MTCRLEATLTPRQTLECELSLVNVEGLIPSQIDITENGIYTPPSGYAYTRVGVDVEGLVPTGTLEITANGTFDVTGFAEADVNVRTYRQELTELLDGTMTDLVDDSATKIKPYAFYLRDARHLPSGYEEIEYVESTGTQYVLANVSFASNATYRIVVEMKGTATNDGVGIGWNAGGGVLLRGNFYGNGTTSGTTTIDGSRRVIITIDINTNGTSDYTFADENGTVLVALSRSNASLSQWSHINYPLFATTGSTGNPPSLLYYIGRIYRFSAYMNGTLTSDFIPVSHNGDIGFYNSVNSTFYGNSGTGTLIGGDVVPHDETESVETVDIVATEIGAYAFFNNDLISLTLRANQLVEIGEHALDGTPIANGTGTIYVPSELLDEYQQRYSNFTFMTID